jgi:hypothetical protein
MSHNGVMENKTYHLMILKPSPSMSHDKVLFSAASYQDAVAVAQAEWKRVRRSVALYSGEWDTYYWHRIDSAGNAVDRNGNSGVPELEVLEGAAAPSSDPRYCPTCTGMFCMCFRTVASC